MHGRCGQHEFPSRVLIRPIRKRPLKVDGRWRWWRSVVSIREAHDNAMTQSADSSDDGVQRTCEDNVNQSNRLTTFAASTRPVGQLSRCTWWSDCVFFRSTYSSHLVMSNCRISCQASHRESFSPARTELLNQQCVWRYKDPALGGQRASTRCASPATENTSQSSPRTHTTSATITFGW